MLYKVFSCPSYPNHIDLNLFTLGNGKIRPSFEITYLVFWGVSCYYPCQILFSNIKNRAYTRKELRVNYLIYFKKVHNGTRGIRVL